MLDMFMHSIWNRSFAQKLLNFEVIQLVLSTPGFLRTSMATTMASWLDLWLSTCLGLLSFAVSTKTLRSEVGNQQKRTVWSSEACRVCCRTVWQQVEQFVGLAGHWQLAAGRFRTATTSRIRRKLYRLQSPQDFNWVWWQLGKVTHGVLPSQTIWRRGKSTLGSGLLLTSRLTFLEFLGCFHWLSLASYVWAQDIYIYIYTHIIKYISVIFCES